jgi:hypothetical protein
MVSAMTTRTCQYQELEKTAVRLPGHDLGESRSFDVKQVWYCRHPFHGIRIELGDGAVEAEERCRVCALPREPAATCTSGAV